MTQNSYGRTVLISSEDGQKLYLTGRGASPEGDRPFLREFDLATKETKELWRSSAPHYETPLYVMDLKKSTMLTSRESRTAPANIYLHNWKNGKVQAITEFEHPYPELKGVEKQVIQYQRKDGIELQGDLYLPKGYKPGQDDPLPVIMWAYPREYKSADDASQVSGSPYSFLRLSWGSPVFWVARGYAVLNNASMHADKINEPMLMIHGEADNNSGTFPLQSKRMYSAINGLGGIARLVMLPHESHGYRARESILHMFWEMDQWLETYVKNRKAVP